ncbi:hypothetical protein ACP70R_018153 [Stipagrostis hirtigluma subsp. patula]
MELPKGGGTTSRSAGSPDYFSKSDGAAKISTNRF